MSSDQDPAKAKPLSMRSSLLRLVLLCIVPALAMASYLAWSNYTLYRDRVYLQTELLAKGMMTDVDRELAVIEASLRVLATSEALRSGDLKRFHQIARDALKSQIVYNYILTDRAGQQVINTLVAYGTPLPKVGTPPQLRRVFERGESVLTDFFIGPVTGKPALAMGVPVFNDAGEVVYSLNIGLAPDRLSALLKSHALEAGWLAALLDSSGTIVGRTREEDRFVGQKAVESLRATIAKERNGNTHALTKEGIPVVTAFASSPRWGWTVVTGAPRALVEDQLRRMMLSIGLLGGVLVLLGTWLALSLIRRLTHSVLVLNDAAERIQKGQPLQLPEVQLVEASAVGQALVRASELLTEVHHRAYHDPLTDLANRALFYQFLNNRVECARRDGEVFSLLMIDLDHFKDVNDTEGHAVGDEVLRVVASRIKDEVRKHDVAARLGGDEFAVILHRADASVAMLIAQRIRSRLSEPYPGSRQPVSASVGVSVWYPSCSHCDHLMEQADKALYEVKATGRNGVRLFSGPVPAAPYAAAADTAAVGADGDKDTGATT